MSAAAKKKVFCAEPFPTVCFRSQPPPHARADETADLPSVSHRAVSACSTEKQRVTLGILCLQRSTRSLSLSLCHNRTGHKWQPSPGWLVCAKPSAPREFASLVEPIRCWHCAHDGLSKRSVYPFLSKRSARWLRLVPSGATAVWTIAVASRSDPRMHCVT